METPAMGGRCGIIYKLGFHKKMHTQKLVQCVNNAHAANARGEYSVAVDLCKQAIKLAPNLPEAWYNQGVAFSGLGKRSAAMNAFEKTRIYALNSAETQNSVGLQLIYLGAYREAEQCFKRALALMPEYAFAHSNLGKLRERQKRYKDAEASCRKAIEFQPDLAPLYTNLGAILNLQKEYEAAEVVIQRAIELDANSPEAWSNLGSALYGLKRYEAVETASRRAIELNAKSPEAWSNLGSALYRLKRYEAAEAASRRAIELDTNSPEAWSNLGSALYGLTHYEAAAECFGKVLTLNAEAEFLLGDLLYAKMKICDWRSFADDVCLIVQNINEGFKAALPFKALVITTDLAVQRKAAEIWVKANCPERSDLGPIPKRNRRSKIRVGYYSADYHNHATSYLMAELFERHSNDNFELIGFSFGPDKDDEMRKRVVAAFDQFIDVRGEDGKAIAKLSREMEIDIAIDLKGYTEDCRTEIFSYRAAPIQVNYLGYPGTMGADYIDYMIADNTLVPVENQNHYTEKIVYLPHSYQINDSKRKISDRKFTREEMGLPPAGFIFCCFNNNYKITPTTFNSWMRILKQVGNSVLWLFEDNQTAADNLRKEAALQGIDSARLVFAKHMTLDEHLARHRLADLFLDTLPYNAHTTASDALWAGLPVLTCIGEAFASRVAASLLNAIGLPELVTSTQADYEALAVELASRPERLAHIKQKLEQNKPAAPLFDTALFTRHIETAYATMYQRYQSGLCPEHIRVDQ